MSLDDRPAQRQTNAEPFGFAGRKREKCAFEEPGRKAWSGVNNTSFDEIGIETFRFDQDAATHASAPADCLDGIAQKVDQDLFDLQEVEHDSWKVGGNGCSGGHMHAVEIRLA